MQKCLTHIQLLTFTINAISFVAVMTPAAVRAERVDAIGIFMARMCAARTFIDFGTIEFVNAPKAGQAIAHIRTDCVYAHRIRVAMVAKLVALLGTLVNI